MKLGQNVFCILMILIGRFFKPFHAFVDVRRDVFTGQIAAAQIKLSLGISVRCGQFQPKKRFLDVPLCAKAVIIVYGNIVLSHALVALCRTLVPQKSLALILGCANAMGVAFG